MNPKKTTEEKAMDEIKERLKRLDSLKNFNVIDFLHKPIRKPKPKKYRSIVVKVKLTVAQVETMTIMGFTSKAKLCEFFSTQINTFINALKTGRDMALIKPEAIVEVEDEHEIGN